jgi:O-antigen ligase
MTKQVIAKNYSQVVNVLIFIFPVVINSLQVAGDLVLFILAMMGIFIAISQKLSPFAIKEIKVFSYLTFGYFIAVCLSVLFSGQAAELAHYIPRDFHFLFAPFIILALYKAKINISYLLLGIKIALIVLGIIVINQLLNTETLWSQRPSGIMNPAVFGNLSVALFFIALVFIQNESFKHKILTLLALLSGLFIIVASGTRGAWLSLVLLSGCYLFFFYKQKIKLSAVSKIITVIFITGIVSFFILNQPLKDRVYSAFTETSDWISNGVSYEESEETKITSAGYRLEMYSTAIQKIKDVPFFGHGYRTSNIEVFKDSKSYFGRRSYGFNHLHNAYLTNYFNGGILLLGGLLLILFVPLVIFIKANIKKRDNPVYISGVLLTLGFASFGGVNILFGDTYMNGFYVFFLSIFLLLANQPIKTSET